MAYDIDQRTGLPMVGGIPLPLTPQQMQAAGIGPASQAPVANMPGGIPLPQGGNPYGGLPPDAVAGSGGGPVIPQPGPAVTPAPVYHNRYGGTFGGQPQVSVDHTNRFGGHFTTQEDAPAAPIAPPPTQKSEAAAPPPTLLPTTVGEAQQSAIANKAGTLSAAAQAVYDATMAGARPTGPAKLVTTSETVKSTKLGALPGGMADDIADQEADIDRQQAAASDMTAVAATHSLQQRADVIKQQQADAAAAQAERARVDQRIASLQAKSDSDEAAMVQAKPQGIKDYWGGSMLAQMISGLSLALGAGVQARTGVNPAEQMLDKSIDRWVNDQKQQYDAAKDKATLSNNRYKDALQTFGTPEAAQAQLRLQSLAAKNALAQNMAEESKVPQWLANAQLEQQRTALQQKEARAHGIQTAGMTTTEATEKLQGGPGSGKSKAQLLVDAAENAAKVTEANNKSTGNTVEERAVKIKEEKQGGAGSQVADIHADYADAIRRVRELSADPTSRVKGTDSAGKLEAAVSEAHRLGDASAKADTQLPRASDSIIDKFLDGKGNFIRNPQSDAALKSEELYARQRERKARVRKTASALTGVPVSEESESP